MVRATEWPTRTRSANTAVIATGDAWSLPKWLPTAPPSPRDDLGIVAEAANTSPFAWITIRETMLPVVRNAETPIDTVDLAPPTKAATACVTRPGARLADRCSGHSAEIAASVHAMTGLA